jgi:hypothetical protein
MGNKNVLPVLFVFGFAGLLCFLSCKKSSSANPSTASMTFNDSAVKLTGKVATLDDSVLLFGAASAGGGYGLTLALHEPFTLDVPLDMDSAGDKIIVTNPGGHSLLMAGRDGGTGHGKVTITSWDSTGHRLAGTFCATVVGAVGDSASVSNGQFDINYTVVR